MTHAVGSSDGSWHIIFSHDSRFTRQKNAKIAARQSAVNGQQRPKMHPLTLKTSGIVFFFPDFLLLNHALSPGTTQDATANSFLICAGAGVEVNHCRRIVDVTVPEPACFAAGLKQEYDLGLICVLVPRQQCAGRLPQQHQLYIVTLWRALHGWLSTTAHANWLHLF